MKIILRLLSGGVGLFALGLQYWLVASSPSGPGLIEWTINFFGNYQLSPKFENIITIDNYYDTISNLILALGIVFELPILVYFLSRIGVLTHRVARQIGKREQSSKLTEDLGLVALAVIACARARRHAGCRATIPPPSMQNPSPSAPR